MKFENEHDEYIWQGSVESGVVTGSGSVDAPSGWFAPINLMPDFSAEEQDALEHYGAQFLILHESNEGFITVLPFEDEAIRNDRINELEQAYGLYLSEVEPEQAVAAIFGYRAAAVLEAAPDAEAPPAVDEEAQRVIRDEVIQFIIDNADDLRTYVDEIGVDWGRVGHEFYLARNGHPAFSDHAGGPVIDELMESAGHYGPQHLQMGHAGELVLSQDGTEAS